MRVLFAGTPQAAVASLRALLASPHEVVAVLTRPDAAAGRGRRLTPSPVAAAARDAGVDVWQPRRLDDPEFLAQLAALAPECCPIVAYGGLVPPAALGIPRHGWVNLHFSLLPSWRGAAPVQHAIRAGDQVTGASTFRLEEGLDTGPVFGVVTEEISPTDTSGDLLARLAESGAVLLVSTLDAIERGEACPVPQPPDDVSYAPKLTTADARIDWLSPALAVDRLVRACTPAPGAWTLFRDERLKILPVVLRPADVPLPPGELAVDRDQVRLGTGSHPVALRGVQPEGKRPMAAADWARGVRIEAGERLT